MYYIEKTLEVAGAHSLELNYESKCQFIHGHNWLITVYCKSKELNHNSMVVDFTQIKKVVNDKLDHKLLNDVFGFNPTAENIARWVCDQIFECWKVKVQESSGNVAIYEQEEK